MRAILIATGKCPGMGTLAEHFGASMLPLVDRPFVQHIVESLAGRRFTEFDVVVSHMAHRIEELLGDGVRWGVAIRYHIARDPERPYGVLRTMSPPLGKARVLLCHADRFPVTGPLAQPTPEERPSAYCQANASDGSGRVDWTGWAWINAADVDDLPADAGEDDLAFQLLDEAGERGRVVVPEVLSARDFASYLASNEAAITGPSSGLLFAAREVDPGVWLSRNVVIHPTARLCPPLYLSEDCQVGKGAQVGPGAIVGVGCFLDSGSLIANSVLLPSTYVGRGVELRNAIVDRNLVIDVRRGQEAHVEDDALLSSISAHALGARLNGLFSRTAATAALALTWPLLLATAAALKAWRGGPVFTSHERVRLPAPADVSRWRTFPLWSFNVDTKGDPESRLLAGVRDVLFRVLPGLVNVARGDLRIVGVPPRSAAEVLSLPEDWRALYLGSKAGLINETSLVSPTALCREDHLVSDSFYAAAQGPGYDLRLLTGYAARAFSWRPPVRAGGYGRGDSGGRQRRRAENPSSRMKPNCVRGTKHRPHVWR